MISSSLSLSKLSKSAGRSKPAQASNMRYSSLEFSYPGSSGYRKRSASPACGNASKRGRSSRGVSPSVNSLRGFHKWESCSCPLTVGGCLSLHWQVWSDKGTDPWVVEVLRWGYRIPFRAVPTLSRYPIPCPSYSPSSIRGKALDAEVLSLLSRREQWS